MPPRKRSFKDRLSKTATDEDQATRARLKHIDERFRAAERLDDVTPPEDQRSASEPTAQPETRPQTRPVRETFALSPEDHAILQKLIDRGEPVRANKSEVIRAALRLFSELPDETLIKRLSSIERRKPGRPVKQ